MDRWLFRNVRGHECLVKRVAGLEIVDCILIRFSEDADVDQIKDHRAEILAARDTPVGENGRHHWTELFQRKLPDAIEQLGTGDVR